MTDDRAMRTSVRMVPALSEEEASRLFGWSADPFDMSRFGLRWRPKDLHFLLDVNGTPVCHVGLLAHTVRVGNMSIAVAGIGGVVTIPDARGLGHARTVLRHALDFVARTWHVDAGLLFCLPRLVPYYARLGWHVVEREVTIDQDFGLTPSPVPVMVLPMSDLDWPDDVVRLESLPW
jgi:GNAT superfamily N-acetyltransferase